MITAIPNIKIQNPEVNIVLKQSLRYKVDLEPFFVINSDIKQVSHQLSTAICFFPPLTHWL